MEKAREETDEGCRSQPNWPKFVISVGKKMKNMNQEEENQMKGRLFRLKMKILNTRKYPHTSLVRYAQNFLEKRLRGIFIYINISTFRSVCPYVSVSVCHTSLLYHVHSAIGSMDETSLTWRFNRWKKQVRKSLKAVGASQISQNLYSCGKENEKYEPRGKKPIKRMLF